MTSGKRYIAMDLGAESGRCVVGELSGDKLSLHEVHRFPTHTVMRSPYEFYWNIMAIFQEITTGLAKASREFGESFGGISIDTWGVDYCLLDSQGRLLGDPYHYRSVRTDGIMEKAFTVVPREVIYSRTGIQFMQFNTLFQLLAEKEQKLNLLTVASTLLPIPNFFLYLLSGIKKAEYTIVSTTQLADPGKRDWCWELIRDFDLPEDVFPPLVEPGVRLGTLLPDIAKKTGVHVNTPVIAGASHDTAAAVAAVPSLEPGWAYLSSGTWSLLGTELPVPLITEQALENNFTNEGGVEGSVRLLKNIAGLWILRECRHAWAEAGQEYTYTDLTRLASEAGEVRAWINPDNKRFLQPGQMPQKVISFLQETNQQFQDSPGWITRCVLESLAFKYRLVLRELESLTGSAFERLHTVGGGTQNELLCQLTADAVQKPVSAGPVEATVTGNIGVQAIAAGVVQNIAEFRKIVKNSFEVKTYNHGMPGYWEEHEQFFRSLCR
jgi:rhamnulokinase